jgi:hypothetical protein
LLDKLDLPGNSAKAPAEIKRATLKDRLVHDRSAQGAAFISVLAVAAAAWGVVDEATGERHAWI